jgi:hypothetical protein
MLNAFSGHSPPLPREWTKRLAFNDPNPAPDWQSVATKIHASGKQLVIAVTGGGSGAISMLLQTPGASRTILEAIVPYSFAALVDWIGATLEQACSEATARAMAMAALLRARTLAPTSDPDSLIGVGATASLATDREKRGERRIHLAIQSAFDTWVGSFSLCEVKPNRADDEQAATTFLLWHVAGACGVDAKKLKVHLRTGRQDEALHSVGKRAEPEQRELFIGAKRLAILQPNSSVNYLKKAETPSIRLVFPGAFNPPHAGHLRMIEVAERRQQRPATWELSITNVDKLPLDYLAMQSRIHAIRFEDAERLIALTRSPTFVEKSELFPHATFIVGIDTLVRIADPKYYDGDPSKRDAAIAEIASRGCRFLAFGRVIDDKFMVLSDLTLPPALAAICDEVPAAEFREDVSSTELRQSRGGPLAPGQ